MRKHTANFITLCRILASLFLLCVRVHSAAFYAAYLFCGFSDMIDGTMARMTNSTSDLGAKLDSVADITFLAAASIQWIPTLSLPLGLWIWIAAIGLCRILVLVQGFIRRKKFTALHTPLNKVTGLLLFLFPLTLTVIDPGYSVGILCTVASFASLQEGILIRTSLRKGSL